MLVVTRTDALQPNELQKPTIKDTAVVRLPLMVYQLTVGRFLSKGEVEGDDLDEDNQGEIVEDDDSEPGKRTPSTDSAEEFELLEKSVDDLGKAKSTGASQKPGKASKRKTKKR